MGRDLTHQQLHALMDYHIAEARECLNGAWRGDLAGAIASCRVAEDHVAKAREFGEACLRELSP